MCLLPEHINRIAERIRAILDNGCYMSKTSIATLITNELQNIEKECNQ